MENTTNNKKSIQQLKNEVYNIEKAINRLSWRFKNDNIKVGESKIIINDLDVKAVDFLIKWVNQQKQETLKENLLFAKIYTYALRNEIEFYKDVEFANNKLKEEINRPIDYHYKNIADDLNRLELTKYFISKGVITDHIKNINLFDENGKLTEKGKKQEEEQNTIIKSISNLPETIKYVKGVWNIGSVYKSLNNTITECINRYKNKP